MLPEITIRSHSTDQFLADKVLYSNSYRIKKLLENSCVVDIGANVGFFSIACALQGAETIYAFEPSSENYQVLLKNLNNFNNNNIMPFQLGVNTNAGFFKINEPKLVNSSFYDFAEVAISKEGKDCYFVKLDEILNMIQEKVYLLKISAPGKELEIIKDSELLKNVENLCFEMQCDYSKCEEILESVKTKGRFMDGQIKKINESRFLFHLSKTKCSICFSEYQS